MAGVVDRVREVWGDAEEEEDYSAFPWVHEVEPSLVGIETLGGRSYGVLWKRFWRRATTSKAQLPY